MLFWKQKCHLNTSVVKWEVSPGKTQWLCWVWKLGLLTFLPFFLLFLLLVIISFDWLPSSVPTGMAYSTKERKNAVWKVRPRFFCLQWQPFIRESVKILDLADCFTGLHRSWGSGPHLRSLVFKAVHSSAFLVCSFFKQTNKKNSSLNSWLLTKSFCF